MAWSKAVNILPCKNRHIILFWVYSVDSLTGVNSKSTKFTVNLLAVSLKNYCTGTGKCYHITLNMYCIVTRVCTQVTVHILCFVGRGSPYNLRNKSN